MKVLKYNNVNSKLDKLGSLELHNMVWILYVLGLIGMEDNEIADGLPKKGA